MLEPKPIDVLREPKIRRSLWQTRAGHPGLVVTAGEQSRIPQVAVLLRGEDGHVTGRTYERVLGSLSMKVMPERDGRVRIEIIPQLEHGDPRSRFVAADGMIKPDYRPETVLFKDLEIDAALSPGQTLILGTRASKPGSLGSHFFTEQRFRLDHGAEAASGPRGSRIPADERPISLAAKSRPAHALTADAWTFSKHARRLARRERFRARRPIPTSDSSRE